MQQETIVQNLGRTLRLLGLRRRKEPAVSLDEYLAAKQNNAKP